MDIRIELWENKAVKTPYNLKINNAFAQPHEALKRAEKRLNILTSVPDKTNFLSLLKEALADNRPYAYKRVPWGRSFYIHQDTVRVMIYILDRLNEGCKDDLLEYVPLRMTELAMKCWEIKGNQPKFRSWFKYRELTEYEYHQYEFEFIRRKDDEAQCDDITDESCPFCGHKTY